MVNEGVFLGGLSLAQCRKREARDNFLPSLLRWRAVAEEGRSVRMNVRLCFFNVVIKAVCTRTYFQFGLSGL